MPEELDELTGRAESIGAVQKILLIDCFQHHGHRPLKDLILECRYTYRPCLGSVSLGNVYPPDRRSLIRPALKSIEKAIEILK